MSYDLALERLCSHEVLFEIGTVDSVLQDTVQFQRPPSSRVVSLFIDDVEVPPSGLYSYAEIPFSNPEPYRITSNKNDLLYFKFGSDPARFVQMITGSNIKAKDIAKDLAIKLPEISVTVENKRVVFRSRSQINGSAFAFPDPRWTDKTSSLPTTARVLNCFKQVGVIPGRVVSGKRLFPGWFLVPDPHSLIGDNMVIQLESPLLNLNPVVQVNYFTNAANCRRCHGIRIEFDYGVVDGTYETVTDADLLSQEFDKFLFTRQGSHWKWRWLGSHLIERIGGKANALGNSASAMVTMDVSQAFRVYQNIKTQQDNQFPQQQVSDAEFPLSLDDITAVQPDDDPTTVILSAQITTRSREPVVLKRVIGNPNPFTLLADPKTLLNLNLTSQPDFLLRG